MQCNMWFWDRGGNTWRLWNRGRVITTVVAVPCNVTCGFGIGEAIHGDCGIEEALHGDCGIGEV